MNDAERSFRQTWKLACDAHAFHSFFQQIPVPKGKGRVNRLLAVAIYREIGMRYESETAQASAESVVNAAEEYADNIIPLAELQLADVAAVDLFTLALTASSNSESVSDICQDSMTYTNLRADVREQGEDYDPEERSRQIKQMMGRFIQIIIDSLGLGLKFKKQWATDTAVALARGMYDTRDFSAMPILADALQDADCADEEILNRLRDNRDEYKLNVWYRGCWIVDKLLGKR